MLPVAFRLARGEPRRCCSSISKQYHPPFVVGKRRPSSSGGMAPGQNLGSNNNTLRGTAIMARQRKRQGSANATVKPGNPRISAFQAGQLLTLATCVAEGKPWTYDKKERASGKGLSAEFSAEEIAYAEVVVDYLESGPADYISKSDPYFTETGEDFWAQWVVTETPEDVIAAMDGFVESAFAKLAEAGVVITVNPEKTPRSGAGWHLLPRSGAARVPTRRPRRRWMASTPAWRVSRNRSPRFWRSSVEGLRARDPGIFRDLRPRLVRPVDRHPGYDPGWRFDCRASLRGRSRGGGPPQRRRRSPERQRRPEATHRCVSSGTQHIPQRGSVTRLTPQEQDAKDMVIGAILFLVCIVLCVFGTVVGG